MPFSLQSILYLSYFLVPVHHAVATQISCSKELYGVPRASDCEELLQSFADLSDDQPRLFDEEQLRTSDGLHFPGVKNDYPTSVVQVPAYWSLGELSFITWWLGAPCFCR